MVRIPEVILISPTAFNGSLGANKAAAAIAQGVVAVGLPVDLCPLAGAAEVERLDFDRRMRAARAVITGGARLEGSDLAGTVIAEVATRARQAGVPCYAIVGRSTLDRFGVRVLDLEAIVEARTRAQLEAAGRELAELIRTATRR